MIRSGILSRSFRVAISLLAALAACSCEGRRAGDGRSASPVPRTYSSEDGRYVVVLHPGAAEELAGPILARLAAEGGRIRDHLGVTDTTPYAVHVRGNSGDFLRAMESSIGTSYPGASGFITGRYRAEILATSGAPQEALHEYAHSMSLFIKPRWYNRPRWLWEALATWESGEFFHPSTISDVRVGIFPTLAELDLDHNSGARLVYEVGYLLFEYLLDGWGMETVKELIRQSGDVPGVLGLPVEEFERRWREFVTERYLKAP